MRALTLLLLLFVSACASVPGGTAEEKRAHIDAWEAETLEMLCQQQPQAREQIAEAAGYLAVRQRVLKIPVFGGGSGYGVLVDRTRDQRLYAKLERLDVGGGWGTRNLRVVVVLHDPALLDKAGKTHWSFGGGAEAAAKAGDTGAAGGAGAGTGKGGSTIYELTDEGVSVTWTVHAIRLSPLTALNR